MAMLITWQTGSREYDDMDQTEAAFPQWEKALKASLTDSLYSLISKRRKAFNDDDRVSDDLVGAAFSLAEPVKRRTLSGDPVAVQGAGRKPQKGRGLSRAQISGGLPAHGSASLVIVGGDKSPSVVFDIGATGAAPRPPMPGLLSARPHCIAAPSTRAPSKRSRDERGVARRVQAAHIGLGARDPDERLDLAPEPWTERFLADEDEHSVGRAQLGVRPRVSRNTKDGSPSASCPRRAGGVPCARERAARRRGIGRRGRYGRQPYGREYR